MSATTAGLTSGLSQASSKLKGFGSSIAGMASGLPSFSTAIIAVGAAGVAAAGGLGYLVSSSIDLIGGLADAGKTLGIAAVEMAGFNHAAKLSGVGADAMTAAMQKLAKSGLDIYQVADQVAAIQDPALRVKYAMDVLGKSGADLIPLLEGGALELGQMVAEGERLSGLEGLDVGAVEAAGDAIDRAWAGFQGIMNVVTVLLAPAIDWMATQMQGFAEWVLSGSQYVQVLGAIGSQFFNAMSAGLNAIGNYFSTTFTYVGEAGAGLFTQLLNLAFNWYAGLEFVFSNFGAAAELSFNEIALWATVAFEEMSHLFLVKIPAVLEWFASNWFNIFQDLINSNIVVFGNLAKNVKMAMTEIWDFIASGGSDAMEFAWTPLTEGFVSAVKELPDIPERAISELEQSLAAESDRLGKTFGEGMTENIQKRRDELLKGTVLGDGFLPPAELEVMPKINPDGSDMELEGLYGVDAKSKKKGGRGGEIGTVSALQRGSSDSFSAIFKAMNGGGNGIESVAKTSKEQLVESRKQTAALRRAQVSGGVTIVRGAV